MRKLEELLSWPIADEIGGDGRAEGEEGDREKQGIFPERTSMLANVSLFNCFQADSRQTIRTILLIRFSQIFSKTPQYFPL